MSQKSTASPQTQRLASKPVRTTAFSVDNVDISEQELIQSQLAKALDSAYERALQEAVRRSLSSCSEVSPLEGNSGIATAMDYSPDIHGDDDDSANTEAGTLLTRGAGPRSVDENWSTLNEVVHLRLDDDEESDVMPAIPATDLEDVNDADDEDEVVPRSRRGQYQQRTQQRSERRPSLDRLNGYVSERRPSLDRLNGYVSERRPSLDRLNGPTSERRPSLERAYQYQSERRPSLDRRDNNQSERRPSLERVTNYRSERRPSLEHVRSYQSERRPSLERRDGRPSERRPSLERLQQHGLERRPSLDQAQAAAVRLQALNSKQDSNSSTQGINTLRPWPLNQRGIPCNWNTDRLPRGDTDDLYCLVKLSPMDREYSAITVDFEEAGLKVASVERLQNPMLLERFNHEKEHLLKLRPPDFELNERYLYHGTQANRNCLCEEGLDHRLSFQGCFGRGIYFSDNPRKCMQYATGATYNVDSTGTQPMILVCRVLLGDSKVYDHGIKDSNLKREPEKPKAKGGWRYYDSVQGIPVDYPEFVVYDNRRSMIEYIVTFDEVAYRAPPSRYNFYTSQVPSLYKVEPIVLPIPEEELDKLYMLGPDTDSDGSCDEHTREVERLRENVKRGKAKRLGIPFRLPTKEEKRYERLHWKRVCYYSCPPNSPLYELMIMKKKEEKAERKKRKRLAKEKEAQEAGADGKPPPEKGAQGHGAGATSSTDNGAEDLAFSATRSSGNAMSEPEEFEVENEIVAEVLTNLIADFLNITSTDDVSTARTYLMENSMDLDKALCQYFREM